MELKRRLLMGGVDQNLDRFLGRLFDDRADEALNRVSTRQHEHEGSLFIVRGLLLSCCRVRTLISAPFARSLNRRRRNRSRF